MTFELTVLGSSSALPTSTKFPSAHVLNVHERFFLIDCGEGTQVQLRRSKIGFGKINQIFISHMHGDHVFGLYGLLSTFQLLGRQKPIVITGPPGLERMLEFFRQMFAEKLPYELQVNIIKNRNEQVVFEDKVVEVIAFPLKHRISTFGYFIREKEKPLNLKKDALKKYQPTIRQIHEIKAGEDLVLESGERVPNAELTEPPYVRRSYAYCSDTMIYKKNLELLSGVNLLYHEATFLQKDKKLAKETRHSTAAQAAEFANDAKAGKLLIGHFSSRYNNENELLEEAKQIFPNTEIAQELNSWSVPLEREK